MQKRNPNNEPSSEGFAGNNFQPRQIPLRQRIYPFVEGNPHYEEQSNQGLDLSLPRNPEPCESFGYRSVNMQPIRNRVNIFAGLPTAGSCFQGYSGTFAGPVAFTAPSVTIQATRSTGNSPLDLFTPLEFWQYMNLPHTVTSQTNALPPTNYSSRDEDNPQFPTQSVNVPDPIEMGQRCIPSQGPLLPTPADQAAFDVSNPLNPSDQIRYIEPRPSTSQHNHFAGPSREQYDHTLSNASTSYEPPMPKRRKDWSGEPQALERINRRGTMPHSRRFSPRQNFGSWRADRHHFLVQTGPVNTIIQARSGQSQNQVTHQGVIEGSKHTGAKRKENIKGGGQIRNDVSKKYSPKDNTEDDPAHKQKKYLTGGGINSDEKTGKNLAKVNNHVNSNAIKGTKFNQIISVASNNNDLLMHNGMPNGMGNIDVPRKGGNNDSINNENKNTRPFYSLYKKFFTGNANDSKFSIDFGDNTSKDHKLNSTQTHTEEFKKPLPIKEFRSKKLKSRAKNEAHLRKAAWPKLKTQIAKVNSKNDLREVNESTDTAFELDNSIGKMYKQTNTTNDKETVQTNESKLIQPKNVPLVAENRTTCKQFCQDNKTNNAEGSNFQKDKSDFRLDKSLFRIDKSDLCGDKPGSPSVKSVSRDSKPVFRDEKPIFCNGKSVSLQRESSSQTDITVSNDSEFIRPTVIWYNPAPQNHAGNNIAETTVPLTYVHDVGSLATQQMVSSNRNAVPSQFNINHEQLNKVENVSAEATGSQMVNRPVPPLEPMWLLDIIAHDPQVHDSITGTPYTNNGQDGGSSYEYYRLTNFQLCHLRVIPDERFWKAYVLDEVMLDILGVPKAMPERKDELEAFSREIIIEALRRDYNVQDVETLRLCVINYLRNYPELRLPLLEKLIKDRGTKK